MHWEYRRDSRGEHMGKKKLSVEEILAAARRQDGGGAGAPAPEEAAPAEAPSEDVQEEQAADDTPAKRKPTPKPGERPSVSDMLAMARGEGGGKKPAKPAAKATPAKKTSDKKAPDKKAPAKASDDAAKPAAAGGPRSTASILEAARAEMKRGPKSKAEAGVKSDTNGDEAIGETAPVQAKPRGAGRTASVPPMPSKPGYAKPAPKKATASEDRRGFLVMFSLMVGTFLGIGFTSLAATFTMWTLGLARFMFPNILTEPPSRFKVGLPDDFTADQVVTKFKAQFGIWVVNGEYNGERQIYALSTVCTHLGCTPNWLEAEQKFKCPCHGSGFYKDGINFEGPAPRPLERYAIHLAEDGQLEVDKSRKFQEEKGEWASGDSFVFPA